MKTLFIILLAVISINTYSQKAEQKPLGSFKQAAPLKANKFPYGNNAKAGHYVHTPDAKIYYEVYGKGQSIVLLHGGIMGSIDEMHQFIDSFSKQYQVIAIASRGHGKSEIGNTPFLMSKKPMM